MFCEVTVNAANLRFFNEKLLDSRSASNENAAPFGGIPEWPKGSDCKSDVIDFEGSNPSPSTRFSESCRLRGYSSVVEPQPSKLMMRVRFPLPAPALLFSQCVLLM